MQHILYIEKAKRLSIEGGRLAVENEMGDVNHIHPRDILAVVLENIYCQVSLPSLLLCVENGIPILICNAKHQPQIYCLDLYRHSELLDKIKNQINWTKERKFEAWQQIVYTKIQHQIDLVDYLNPYEEKTLQIKQYRNSLIFDEINEENINTAESISARMYFKALLGTEFRRFAPDTVNHALNYGYAVIRALIMVAITVKGLHPALGIWHHSIRNRFNLADDIIEILRPMVDYKVSELKFGDSLSKEQKVELLNIVHMPVYWQGKPHSLRQAINLYLDNLVSFMNQSTNIIVPIELRIDKYGSK